MNKILGKEILKVSHSGYLVGLGFFCVCVGGRKAVFNHFVLAGCLVQNEGGEAPGVRLQAHAKSTCILWGTLGQMPLMLYYPA